MIQVEWWWLWHFNGFVIDYDFNAFCFSLLPLRHTHQFSMINIVKIVVTKSLIGVFSDNKKTDTSVIDLATVFFADDNNFDTSSVIKERGKKINNQSQVTCNPRDSTQKRWTQFRLIARIKHEHCRVQTSEFCLWRK